MEKANHLDSHLTIGEKITKGTSAGENFQMDGNIDIQAKGADIATATNVAQKATDFVTSLETQLAAAIIAKNTAETNLGTKYNSGVDKANEVYPGNVEKLKGLSLTMGVHKSDVPVCEKGTGGSVVQSGHSGKASFHCNPLKYAKDIRMMETQSTDTMNEANYYPANPTSFDNSKGGEITPKNTGIITWWRFYGHNASGDGIWSDPIGGFPIH